MMYDVAASCPLYIGLCTLHAYVCLGRARPVDFRVDFKFRSAIYAQARPPVSIPEFLNFCSGNAAFPFGRRFIREVEAQTQQVAEYFLSEVVEKMISAFERRCMPAPLRRVAPLHTSV
jgi:hypothetical protein